MINIEIDILISNNTIYEISQYSQYIEILPSTGQYFSSTISAALPSTMFICILCPLCNYIYCCQKSVYMHICTCTLNAQHVCTYVCRYAFTGVVLGLTRNVNYKELNWKFNKKRS